MESEPIRARGIIAKCFAEVTYKCFLCRVTTDYHLRSVDMVPLLLLSFFAGFPRLIDGDRGGS